MNEETQLRLQSYVDGELPEGEIRPVEALLQQSPEARELMEELRQTRSAMAGQELLRPVPESREFYWSKIRRQIESEGEQRERHASGRAAPSRPWWRAAILPAGALAATVGLALIVMFQSQESPTKAVAEEAADSPEPITLTFQDQQEGLTIVWLTYNE